MVKVKLLKEYQDKRVGEIVEVSNNEAHTLIEEGVARLLTTRDALVKPEFGASKAIDFPPNKGSFKKGNR